MSARLPSAWMTFATVLALAGWNAVAAKPADLPRNTRVTCEPEQCQCPYLQEQARRQAAPAAEASEPATVLENLYRLERASKLYRKGQRYVREGKVDAACRCFEKVQELCPGSPLDAQASASLQCLRAQENLDPEPGCEPKHAGLTWDVLNALRSCVSCDLDCSKSGVVRAQCTLTELGLTCRLKYDGRLTLECGPAPLVVSVMRGLGCLKNAACGAPEPTTETSPTDATNP